jgi:hypothetical protein
MEFNTKKELHTKYRALSSEMCQNADNAKRRAESHALKALLVETDVLPPYAKEKDEMKGDHKSLAMLEHGRYMAYHHAMNICDTLANELNR